MARRQLREALLLVPREFVLFLPWEHSTTSSWGKLGYCKTRGNSRAVHHIAQIKERLSSTSLPQLPTTANNCYPRQPTPTTSNRVGHRGALHARPHARHIIPIQLISTRARSCPSLPNRPCPDGFVPLRILACAPLLLNSKETPARKLRRRTELALLANWHTIQHPPEQVRPLHLCAVRGYGRVDRPAESEASRDSPQILCESVRAVSCWAAGVPGGRSYGNSLILSRHVGRIR